MGILDKLKEGYETVKNASNKSVTDYEKEGGPKAPSPKKAKPAPVVPEDDMPATGPDGKYLKPVKLAKGGSASARADGCAIRGKTRA
jgi:hypothetical protein